MDGNKEHRLVSVPVPSHLVTGVMRYIAEHTREADAPSVAAIDGEDPVADESQPALNSGDWTADDLMLLMRDPRPSARRIHTILDVLANRPDTELSVTELAAASGLTHGELRGAFSGLPRICRSLRNGVHLRPPIVSRIGPSSHEGQRQEMYYCVTASLAERWRQARA